MICQQYSCLFVHIPKTAGQSIEHFFLDRLGLNPETGRGQLLMGKNPNPGKGTEKLSHLSAAEYTSCGFLDQEIFDRLFKFSFVRNPWERIVSEYRYRNYLHHWSFRDFLLHRLPQPGWGDKYRHIMPQYEMLHDENGKLLVDFVGRFENLQADFDRVCDRLGIEDSALPHRNRSDKQSRNLKRWIRNWFYFNGENSKQDFAEFYCDETIELVGRIYQKDLEVFGYPDCPASKADG